MPKFSQSVMLAAGIAISTVGAASASTMHFDYTGGSMPANGPTVTCHDFGLLNGGNCSVTQTSHGLGVNGRPDTRGGRDQIDGFPLFSSERLTFQFDHDVVWHEITLGRWDTNDDLRLTWAGDTRTFGPGVDGPLATVALGGVVSNFLTVTAYGLIGQDGLGNDSFTAASLKVAPVPLPAAGWMLLAGLGGMVAMKRRKKAVA